MNKTWCWVPGVLNPIAVEALTAHRGGNARVAGKVMPSRGAQWDHGNAGLFRKGFPAIGCAPAGAAGVPAFGADAARDRDSRKARGCRSDLYWAGGQTQRWQKGQIALTSRRRCHLHPRRFHPPNPSLRTCDFPRVDFPRFTLATERPSIPSSKIGAVGLCVHERDNDEGVTSPL